ncbi:LutC/YkgG family protein [Paraburkholderia sp. J41]|uniref:LutC/YkgG family protein n=1 Tax=Paraburkholderia sp. J41 TaxID=2805433 RepID=UPI002AC347F4|nr:LUD domain-containing protein [Paraburkholderia sp. J41]
MADREAFLARIRAAQPAPEALPEVPLFETPAGDLHARFVAALNLMGGREITVQHAGEVRAFIAERFGCEARIASATPEVEGTRTLDANTPPASLEDIDVGVVRARFGVAETGSLWFSESEYVVNSLGYLVQHLVVLLDPAQLVAGLQDAYRRDDFRAARYAVLVTGPSATADIEGVLIQGAQGVRSLTVVWLSAPLGVPVVSQRDTPVSTP